MSLLRFHIVLMVTAALLAGRMAFWGFENYASSHHPVDAVTAGLSILTMAAIAVYLVWFIRKAKRRYPFG